jgi:gas vesicle protein
MRSFITGMLVGMVGGAAAACYFGNDKVLEPETKKKTRKIVAHSLATGCLLGKMGGQAGEIVRKQDIG